MTGVTQEDRTTLINGIIEDEIEGCVDDAPTLIREWLRDGLVGFNQMNDHELLEYASSYLEWGEPESELHQLTPLVRRLCAEHPNPETSWLKPEGDVQI